MKIIFTILLLVVAQSSLGAEGECVRIPERYRTEGPFSIKELEAESLQWWDERKDKLQGSVPRAPFGRGNADWKRFAAKMRSGDKLLKYDEGCCTGIMLVRGDCIVELFELSES